MERALARVEGGPLEALTARGFELVEADLRYGPVVLRGRIDLNSKRLTYDPTVLAGLGQAMRWKGLAGDPFEIMLAHELFHLLEPGCRDEDQAHEFAGRLLGLDYHPRELDALEREYRCR
ncbi:MAG: hypothetical protein AB7S38_22395 [Vulcanimicrobiota bacterium]